MLATWNGSSRYDVTLGEMKVEGKNYLEEEKQIMGTGCRWGDASATTRLPVETLS